ncbi:hypothetical protein V6N13_117917 [Hibiscus sabdariffa]|uniref:Transmembrane protein n=1 Tax=Hibiscus sabdariffa TaxID=183260 RepID=A0ABR2Q997_9ROSI
MVIGTATENQTSSPFHLFKPYLLCVSILVPSVVLSSFLGLGFSVIVFTTTILILSTSFLVKFSKKTKVVPVDDSDAAGGADNGSDDSGSSENGELKWMVSGDVEQNPEFSDEYSTSDEEEEGLIEIDIPSNEETEQNMQFSLPSLLAESVFQQQDLVELLAEINEVNEEENLIEIDISMGSIKCPASGIEA